LLRRVVVGCQAFGVVFVGFGGWEVVAGMYDDFVLGGFAVVGGGEGAEEAGDVGESGGNHSGTKRCFTAAQRKSVA
jgi:hypothetical protein